MPEISKAGLIFWKDRVYINALGAGLVLNIVIWIYVGFGMPDVGWDIPLHYVANMGIDLWGEAQQLLILPAVGLVILVAGAFSSIIIFRRARLAARALIISTAAAQVVVLAGAVLIISLP